MHIRKKQKKSKAVIGEPNLSYEEGLPDVPIASKSIRDDGNSDGFFSDEELYHVPIAEEQITVDSNESRAANTAKSEDCNVKSEIDSMNTVGGIAINEQKPVIEIKSVSERGRATDNNEDEAIEELDVEGSEEEDEVLGRDKDDSQHSSIVMEEIKKEQIAEDVSHLEGDPVFSNDRNCYYCCRVCDRKMTDHMQYFDHLESAHKLKYRLTKSSNFELEPLLEDPNFYCRTCEKSYSSQGNYRMHLQWVHHMMIKSCKVSLEQALSSNMHAPEFYCGACDLACETKDSYYRHLNTTHRISSFGPRANPCLEPDLNNPYNYCRPCDKLFRNPNRFRGHLNDMHNINLIRHPELMPDWHSDSCYCPSCELDLLSRKTFHDHCVKVHKFDAHGFIEQHDQNDARSPQESSLRCRVCSMDFEKWGHYRQHCRLAHKMELKPVDYGHKMRPTRSRDPRNESNHCVICNKKFKTKKPFKRHLEKIHAMVRSEPAKEPRYHCSTCDRYFRTGASCQSHFRWKHSSIQQPVINDPNHCCRTCKEIYSSPQAYNLHLQQAHNIDVAAQLENRADRPTTSNSNTQTCPIAEPLSSTQERTTEAAVADTLKGASYTDLASFNKSLHTSSNGPLQSEQDPSDTVPPIANQSIPVKRVTIHRSGSVIEYIIPENNGRPKPRVYTDPNLPDPHDPTFYCRICKKFKRSELKHRLHCKQVHKMDLGPYFIPLPNPNAEIDLEAADCYCARCDKRCPPRSFFMDHLKRIHGIISNSQQTSQSTKHNSSNSTTRHKSNEAVASVIVNELNRNVNAIKC
ncbi:hypothetical protein BD408DRAFT_439042 [Parasitella parasitica]|nr:hypothetical protein BD408DRAFT_439042 [Parasitella parasitica]